MCDYLLHSAQVIPRFLTGSKSVLRRATPGVKITQFVYPVGEKKS